MLTVELLEQSLDLAKRLGYIIRQEFLNGNGGGGCVLRGRKILFIDLALGPAEQLDSVIETLRHDDRALEQEMSGELREMIAVKKSA
jgi:hypothetical protein